MAARRSSVTNPDVAWMPIYPDVSQAKRPSPSGYFNRETGEYMSSRQWRGLTQKRNATARAEGFKNDYEKRKALKAEKVEKAKKLEEAKRKAAAERPIAGMPEDGKKPSMDLRPEDEEPPEEPPDWEEPEGWEEPPDDLDNGYLAGDDDPEGEDW